MFDLCNRLYNSLKIERFHFIAKAFAQSTISIILIINHLTTTLFHIFMENQTLFSILIIYTPLLIKRKAAFLDSFLLFIDLYENVYYFNPWFVDEMSEYLKAISQANSLVSSL